MGLLMVGLFALLFVLAATEDVSASSIKKSVGGLNTIITGHVYQAGTHNPVFDAEVIATCNGRMGVDYTSAQGYYAMSIVRGCPVGSIVTACVTGGDCRDGDVFSVGGYLMAYINLECNVNNQGQCIER